MSRVSFVVPCFDGGDLLGEAVDSVLASTHEDIDVVVVDDGSSDPGTERGQGTDSAQASP